MKNYNYIIKNLLQKEYIQERKSIPTIASELNCSKSLILKRLKKYNIPRRNYSESTKGISKNKNNQANYIDGRTLKKYYCIETNCNNKICMETALYGLGKCNSCRQLGHKVSKITRKKIGEANKGENSGCYIHGKGYEPYTSEFNNALKAKIRKRDGYECQGKDCNMTEEEHLIIYVKLLSIHHIDYNKHNCDEDNLVSLCQECNMKANYNRDYWFAYFKYIIN